ncbi:MAG: diadenylate cyclase CdaA [Lentisphaeria bacterium]|nr:diadenylate cyclase CdaA [Lentisphaeria bacterium]MBR7127368.1 diadenylate cyclase CdaA [Lentisphaeria bacterium]
MNNIIEIEFLFQYIRPLLEILILSFLIYKTLYYLRGARASFVLAGLVLMLMTMTLIARFLHFDVINGLLDGLWTIIALAVIVIFQPELRRAFAQLGTYAFSTKSKQRESINELVSAADNLSHNKIGALIVVEGKIQMQAIVEDAIELDNKVLAIELESIFFPNAPMHDGAVVIRDNRIIAARAVLPITRDRNIPKRWGTRHRAAIGITEETDAVVLVVSEETGVISVAVRGHLWRNIPFEKLHEVLEILIIRNGSDSEVEKLLGRERL